MLWLFCMLIAMLVSAPLTEACIEPNPNYYIESPLFNFFIVPRRAITRSDARYVFTKNVKNCTCRTACFTLVGCKAWSVTRLSSGDAECRLSKKGPNTAMLEKDPNSTYFFEQENMCNVSEMSNLRKIFTYPREMLQEVAVNKTANASSIHNNGYRAKNANDNNNSTIFTTKFNRPAWWMVDFGTRRTIFHIMLLPRTDAVPERYSNVEIRIFDSLPNDKGTFHSNPILNFYKGPYGTAAGTLLYSCSGVTGRYLAVSITKGYLGIRDIQVLALKNNESLTK